MKSKRKFFRRALSVVLSLVMLVSVMAIAPVTVGATSRTQDEAVAWINSQVGQKLDYDGAYGAQCVDLIYYYYAYLGVTVQGGNAYQYTSNSLPSGWSRDSSPRPGDICVWGSYVNVGTWTTGYYGHVGLVTSVGSSTVTTVEQNLDSSNDGNTPCQTRTRQTANVTCFIHPDFSGGSTPHTHSYTTESYQWYDHPHYQCYSCSCGDIQVNTSEPEFQPEANTSCSHCKWSVGSGIYATITNRATGKALTSETNNNVDFQTNTESLDQIWYLTRNDDGSYYIQSMRNGWYLDLYNGITSNKTNVWTYAGNQTDAQKWFFSRTYNDDNVLTYSIISKLGDSLAIEMAGGGTSDGTNAQVFRWNLTDAQIFMVNQISVSSFELNESDVSLEKGETSTLSYSLNPSSLSDLVTWSSSDTDIATVDNNGKVKAVGVGTATITAKLADGSSTQCTVTVKEKSSITLSSTELTMNVGESQQLTATVTPSEYADDIEWSSDADGMEVDVDEDGTITVNSYTDQVVNITAELPDGTKAVCKVTVDSDGKDYETVYLEVGEWYYIGDWDSDFVDPEDIGTFESSDTGVATVNEYGVIEGVSNGTAIVTYTDLDGNSSSFAVTVVDALSDSIDVAVGGERFMDIGSNVTLESSDTSVAIVEDCFVIGVSAGTATITATAESGATSSCTVYVNELEGIHFGAADNESINLGDSYWLDYLYTDPYDDWYVGNVTWTSSDESIATVDADGIVTAVSLGTATITATTDEGFSAACTVTVNAIRGGVENIEVTKLPSKEFTEELDKNWFVTDEDGYVYIDYDAAGLDFYEEMEEFDNKLICYNMAGAELKVTFKDGTEETFTVEENASLKGSPNLGYYYFDIDGETLTVAVSDIGGYEAMITCYDYITTFSVKPNTGNDDNTVIKGDVNDDGKVNVRDASRILQYICGWNVTVNVRVIDVNGDGKVNVRDASRLLQYICGWKVDIYIDTLK